MIKLSDEYKSNIIKMFGELGSNWIDSIPTKIEKYVKKFKLSNIKVYDSLTYNIIIFADSEYYGKVILKIEIPYKEMTIRESLALELNNGGGASKCYFKDIDDGVLLVERLMPGISLNTIDDLEERVKIFSDVRERFNIRVNSANELPSYTDILNRSINMAHEQQERFSDIKSPVLKAESLYSEIARKNDNNYLLHSDLHGENILLSGNEWKAIDPHGFIGNKVFDNAIFIQKELDKIGYSEENIDRLIELIVKYNDFSKESIAYALYVNYVLNLCWDKEVNLDVSSGLEKTSVINSYIEKDVKKKTLNNN